MPGVIRQWGEWPGTVRPAELAEERRLTGFAVTPAGDAFAWTEHCPPTDSTRLHIAACSTPGAWSPEGVTARCRMHGYGGRAVWAGTPDYPWLFIQDEDQGLWAITANAKARSLFSAPGCRHGDCDLNLATGRLVLLQEEPAADQTRVLMLNLHTGAPARVISGSEPFCASPRLSRDGRYIAWISWDENEMPWTKSRLWCMDLDGGVCEALTDGESAVIEPRWGPDGALYYLDDHAGWWQLHRRTGRTTMRLSADRADLGRPPWQLAHAHHIDAPDGGTIAVRIERACCSLIHYQALGPIVDLHAAEVDITQLQFGGDAIWYLGASEDAPRAICRLDIADGSTERVVRERPDPRPESVSRPQAVTAEGAYGPVHGYFYPPRCPETRGPRNRPAPLLVRAHGGPTAMRSPAWNPEVQFWTGHGIAVVEVNYSGSSGHGRAYRQRLRGKWGLADRDDCLSMAEALVAEGLCDRQRLFIAGNSAGGLTVLNTLRVSRIFRAGLCRWGVTDLARLATLTHRFERGYLDFLVGDPVAKAACYTDRSPAANAVEIRAPVLLIQGDADRIVPASQATAMAGAMSTNGGRAELHVFPDEGHGLRRAEHIRCAAEIELAFVRRLLNRTDSNHGSA